jgi:hypothetical protein
VEPESELMKTKVRMVRGVEGNVGETGNVGEMGETSVEAGGR